MFQAAKPIFLKNLSNEMNVTAFFTANFECEGEKALLRITGATYYRVTINGEFAGFGPARAPKGFVRVDELDISSHVSWGLNQIVVEVAGYNCRSFACLRMQSFLQAEVFADGNIVAATGRNFIAFLDTERVQKAHRFSAQRQFSEVYVRGGQSMVQTPVEVISYTEIPLKRDVPYPDYSMLSPKSLAFTGSFTSRKADYPKFRFVDDIKYGKHDGFPKEEISYTPLYDFFDLKQQPGTQLQQDIPYPVTIKKGEYVLLDMGRICTGFIRSVLQASKNARLLLTFSERIIDGVVEPAFNNLVNMIDYHFIQAGSYENESFEPYSFQYLGFYVLDGELTLENASVRAMQFRLDDYPKLQTNDPTLLKIYEAGVNTFRQNTVDVFMDCPSRERAGWLFDSYYTAQTEFALTGKNRVEESFLNNFVLAESFDEIPDGMVPMCYPGDTLYEGYIPQWGMWFVLEIYEHLQRNPMVPKEKFKERVYGIYRFLSRYLNADGLLEKLPGWNFVEWSKCNSWTNDVNYPTNMLFAETIEKIGLLYSDEKLLAQAKAVRQEVLRQSFNGTYFLDHAVRRDDGTLELCEEDRSETCQYYAILFHVADLQDPKFAALKDAFYNVFGPIGTHVFPPYEPSNFVPGVYLRLSLLLRLGAKEQLLKEIQYYFSDMAAMTGTLWEHNKASDSLNHGFASFASAALLQIFND